MKQVKLKRGDFKLISQKNGIGKFIYRSPNYSGPIALNATVKKDGTSTTSRTTEQKLP